MDSSQQRPSYLRRTTCVKCSLAGQVVLNGKDVYCKSCFDEYSSHKFRSSFGKHKIFQPPNERVLLAISGGPSSTGVLIDLIQRSCSADAHKRLQIQPEMIHIVESAPVKTIGDFNLPSHFVHIGSIFEDESKFEIRSFSNQLIEIDHLPGSQHLPLLIKLLESFSTDTSRLDFYRRIKTFILVRCARKMGIRYLMVGETCTELSSRILSNTTQGRGGQTRDDVQVLDIRWAGPSANDGVRIVRPLREFQSREIAYYNHFRQIDHKIDFEDGKPDFLNSSTALSSLQGASDEFVEDLQSRFPATVSTLFASASKLMSSISAKKGANMKEVTAGTSDRCRLCASVITIDEDCEFDILKGFCYGCNLTLSDLPDLNRLPAWMISDQ